MPTFSSAAANQSIGQPQDTAAPATTNVSITLDALTNRHPISSYVYGGAYPQDASTITDSGMTVVRWGGNATSRYNWKTFTYNAANDWFFEDFNYTEIGDGDSAPVRSRCEGSGQQSADHDDHAALGGEEFGVELLGQQIWFAVL